jgi:hypothetical protein
MNLLDLNAKILEMMPLKKIKELVKNHSEKLEYKNQENPLQQDEIKEKMELYFGITWLIASQK